MRSVRLALTALLLAPALNAATPLVPLAAPLAAPLHAQIPATEFAARREALVERLDDGAILVLGAPEAAQDYLPWSQSRPFYYLTGFREPNAALLLARVDGTLRATLFVEPRDPAQEVWTGARLGVDGVRPRLGIDGRHVAELRAAVDSVLRADVPLYVIGDFFGGPTSLSPHEQFVNALKSAHPDRQVIEATRAVAALRGKKSPAELERLRIAAEISARGHLAAFALAQPGIGEWELQAAAEQVWRRESGDVPGYGSIVGSGPNATTLHYNANARVAQAGEVIVMDMATQFDGYSADITRTIPVSGRFSPAQRDIYEIVLAAQLAAERVVAPGVRWAALNGAATAALAQGLARIGLIDSPTATYDCGTPQRARNCSQLSLFYMHGLGHGIGLDVHDPDQYELGAIGVGSAFTIEPGIYVRENLPQILPQTPNNAAYLQRTAAAFERYKGIGVRIEDDYLVTATGVERPSALVPREAEAVERLLQQPRAPRDTAVTNRVQRMRTGGQ
jgi:Xaa-Pro aminopeptidase